MSDVLKKIRSFMEKEGIPGRDGYDLATSPKGFADGAKWRIEIAGVERASTMAAMIDEARKRDVVVHRAIATVGGSTYCDFEELKAMAQMAREAQIEVVMTVGHRKAWDTGSKELSNPEGAMVFGLGTGPGYLTSAANTCLYGRAKVFSDRPKSL